MIMASSSIEVMGMGGNEVKVMLVQNSALDEGMAKRMQDIINSTGPPGHIIDNNGTLVDQLNSEGQDEEFSGISQFPTIGGMEPPPGTIIFSPQDLVRPARPVTRGRGRGRGNPIKQEVSVDNSQGLEVPVACEICNKVMMTGKTLVQHMAIHSDLKPFQCPHCPKSFARKVHLQGHLVIHGIEKQFECPVCHQRFSRQDCVKVHMRLHDKSKCVYCDVCHKAFLTVGALNIHLRIHRGEKPFKCHLCSKCFTQKNHLITHIKRHTKVTDEHFTKKLGPRMFKCEHCTRAFIRLSDYERHVQWNHGAVADGSVIDKLPTVSNLVDGEMKQTGLLPQVFRAPKDAMNTKPNRIKRRRKVMCTTSTQTDEDGGRVIIPRMYQSQVSAATQVSAPPTPRPADDDMYENDIFDEGMDRNYSSDEDEDDPGDMDGMEDKKIYEVVATSEMASDPVQDAAFDAVVQGASSKPLTSTTSTGVGEGTNDQHAVFLQEVVSTISKQGLDVREPEEEEEEKRENLLAEEERMEVVESSQEMALPSSPVAPISHVPSQPPTLESTEGLIPIKPNEIQQSQEEMEETFNDSDKFTNNLDFIAVPQAASPLRGRGRGRPRGRGSRGRKYPLGLTGAAELRFMRKNMIMSILNATNEKESESAESSKADEDVEKTLPVPAEDVETEGRVKRMAKKEHGKDFVCNMKNCETCLPSQKLNLKLQSKVKVKLKEDKDIENSAFFRKTLGGPAASKESPRPLVKTEVASVKSASPKLWKPNNAGIVGSSNKLTPIQQLKERMANRQEEQNVTQGNVENKVQEIKMKVGNRVGTYPVDITANPVSGKVQKQDFFVATSKSDSIVSPPVELMSFCIPTYSCKLCGREFRFEGKLHRHIESVHQNKVIFSADVKPGRGSSKYVTNVSKVAKIDEMPLPPSQPVDENPEIAALRSEWDDDDDDDDNEDTNNGEGATISVTTANTTIPSVSTFDMSHLTITSPTEISPITMVSGSTSYSAGVKLNMNKLSGLLPSSNTSRDIPVTDNMQVKENNSTRISTSVAPSHAPREPETIMADTLDMKCRRLLEKLFDHDLLLSCGLLEEHVSVVLGRVLQHYGVKMIEDYGQGQYEVLKYNMWRLIEWKVTMEQMEEFYTAGKSVEEMMDYIMDERVPLLSHQFISNEQKAHPPPPQVSQAGQVTQMETVEVSEGQMVLQQVAGVLGGQINLPEGVTQVVLAQDVSPDLLQGAHIVTIDPTTGQVLSQVTADQVILTDAIGDELEQQVAALDGQVVVSQAHISNQNVTQGSIVVPQSSTITVHGNQGQMSHRQVMVHTSTPHHHHQQSVKLETSSHTSAQQPHPHHSHHHHQQ